MYISEGNIPNSKYVLSLLGDGSLRLKWYSENTTMVEKEPIMVKRSVADETVIEFGDENLFGIRQTIPFMTKDGKLDGRWSRIK